MWLTHKSRSYMNQERLYSLITCNLRVTTSHNVYPGYFLSLSVSTNRYLTSVLQEIRTRL